MNLERLEVVSSRVIRGLTIACRVSLGLNDMPHRLNRSAKTLFALAMPLALSLTLSGCAANQGPTQSKEGLQGGLGSGSGTAADFVATAGDRVLFENDSSELTDSAQAILDKQAQWLSRFRRLSIKIEGHADERGTREYNFALGARRAETTRAYLAARGVATTRIRVVSYGKERPIVACDDVSCWSQNRRAVTVVGAAGA